MLFDAFLPGDLFRHTPQGMQELFRIILMRTNFVPVLRHVIGWRGLKQLTGPVEGWTARIHGFDGVFGIFFVGLDNGPGWIRGAFRLHYFPHPDEELVERCSLQAAALSQSGDYMTRVRDFMSDPAFADLFYIADLTMGVDAERKSLTLGLEGFEALRIVCEAGVTVERDGQRICLIEPGGLDSNFPAFATAFGFFDILAASMTFNLGQAPGGLLLVRMPGFELRRCPKGQISETIADDNCRIRLTLRYGQALTGEENGAQDACGETCRIVHDWAFGEPVPEEFADRRWWTAHRLQGASSIDKKALGVDARPPLIVLTGFLGSGKTSFLKHFIEYQTQHSRFVAVIQNEIGSVGLDGKLLDYAVTEIDEGCVCCSLSGSLNRAVKGIVSSFDPDYIIVETTGLANPFNMLEEMEELTEQARFDCILTVVDAPNVQKTLAGHPIAVDQIRAADIVMLNKRDLVGVEGLESVMRMVREHNPHAPVFPAVNGELHPALVLDADDRPNRALANKGGERHHLSHMHEGLWSKSVRLERPLEREAFLATVDRLPSSIFRAKGVIEFADSPQALLFQYVGGRYEISIFPEQSDTDRFVTLIGQGGDPQSAAEAITALSAL
ncbi:GTPase, G3E family [Desulfomicrobium apsheronum]|uniref:GTPase, G3E family n=1 Tax=Desulfomicrobium apsheronum TaxID=52560 RepID=A0A1I3MWU7_9BACT|nr:GTP-binding protein [Desulfomicrobium apsheronum]SFJ01250.1 GTPase, G3E family [Desulfomicrobium apsheronum]